MADMAECSEPSFALVPGVISEMGSPIVANECESILAEYAIEDDSSDEGEGSGKENWIPLDEDLLCQALNGGPDRSRSVNSWARRRFDEWRKDFGLGTSIPVEKLDLRELNRMLTRFMLQAKKKNGKVYPPGTLNSLLRGIGRIVRRERQRIQGETGIRDIPFDILTDPIFSQTREAFACMVKKLRTEGNYDKPKKKAPVISFAVEKDILDDLDHQITHPTGCIKRLMYYMLTRFGIRGDKELHNVKDCDMALEVDDVGELVKYGERLSKNYTPSVTKYDDRHFRQPVWTYEKDFVLTYKQYVRHLPAKENEKESRHFFLQPIPRYKTNAWYAVTPVGKNSISKWLNTMAAIVHPETQICNKSGRVSLVSRLSAASVPSDVGMAITGHKSTPAYEMYDRTRESKINACMDLIRQPINDDGTMRAYKDVLSGEVAKHNLVENTSRKPLQELTVLRASESCGNVDVAEVPSGQGNLNANVVGAVPHVISGENASFVPLPEEISAVGQIAGKVSDSAAGQITVGGSTSKASQMIKQLPCIEIEEDIYDAGFYDELSKVYPDSAKAIGKYTVPVINTQGTFNNCTFNISSVDMNQLVGVISALNKNRVP